MCRGPGTPVHGWPSTASSSTVGAVAAAQAARTGWAKIIADWGIDDEPVPLAVIRSVVEAVHAVGGRLAAHTQQAAGGLAVVAAGVDSVEHGMCLDPAVLPTM